MLNFKQAAFSSPGNPALVPDMANCSDGHAINTIVHKSLSVTRKAESDPILWLDLKVSIGIQICHVCSGWAFSMGQFGIGPWKQWRLDVMRANECHIMGFGGLPWAPATSSMPLLE